MILNIAIPTFNRNETLNSSLMRLLPQITDECRLFILDNHSALPVEGTACSILDQYPHIHVEVLRNRYNIGAHANILRCFEYADADWLWVLGDDDFVAEDAVSKVLEAIREHDEAVFLGFRNSAMVQAGVRETSYLACGLEDFAQKVDDPGAINFMSTSIWHVPKVVSSLSKAYHYAYSMSHTFVLLLSSLGENGICFFSDKVLIESATNAEVGVRWKYKDFVLGFNTVLELPISNKARKILGKKLMSWHPPENVAVYFLADASKHQSGSLLYRIAAARLGIHMPGPWNRFRFHLYRILFIHPRFGWKVVRAIVGLAVRFGLKHVRLEDIENR